MRFFCFCLAVMSGFCGCRNAPVPHRETLRERSEPFDMFSFQRSWPDRTYDWKGWRNAILAAQQSGSVQERGAGGCLGNITDWTQQGPANIAGRVNALAVKPDDDQTVLAGFSAGGIFKTTDGGVNWRPVFDDNLQLSIGDITFDPDNPNIVYAGTGDPNMPSIVFNGDGIYKSTDAGETWNYLGLSQQGIVSKIIVDPSNTQTLYAATMGNPYVRDNERGIYKSTDGGMTWTQVLFVSNQAGASDLVINPANPQILYASFWDRIRNNSESVIYGPHARVYKTTNGGASWTQLGGGLPTGIMGRTGLAISQHNPDKLYALYVDSLSTPGGLYKTVDGGATWAPVNIDALEDKYGGFGWYFGKIRLDPSNDEDVYFLAIILWRKKPGTNTWQTAAGGHADSHDLIFTPSGRRYWANDGGVYVNNPGQSAWTKCNNLPTTQFYHTNYNLHFPDTYYGGAQDNGIKKGNGTAINNWASIFGADGFRCAFHPTDPNTFWIETQNGAINKTTDGGDSWSYGGTCLGTSDRCNWDTPYFLSIHAPDKFFGGTYRVYFSSNGQAWAPISGDLTDGIVLEPRFHTISCVQESPVLPDKLLAGTSDGNVWRREPTGSWINITPGLPERYVTSVHGSPTLPNRIFTTHSGFRDNDYIPHIHRSDDNGQSWTDISGDLPPVPANDLFVLPGHADSVLFAATDAGVYYTLSGGSTWARLGGNMPFIPVFDLEHNPARKQLAAATFARGIWTFPIDSIFSQQNAITASIGGAIRTSAGVGVSKVGVGNQVTGSDGNFTLTGLPGCQSYALHPYRNDYPLNGVSTFDLVLISKHILALTPFDSPYKIIAADANKSKSVTSLDVVTIRKLILGIDTAFAQSTSWRFVPSAYTFPNPLNPFQTSFPESIDVSLQTTPVNDQDFIAVKVGDINGSANPALISPFEERTSGAWPIGITMQDAQKEQKIAATITGDLANIAGFQFSLIFNLSDWEFEGIEPLYPGLSTDHFGANRVQQGVLSVCFENPDVFASLQTSGRINKTEAEQPLFRLIFTAKKNDAGSEQLRLGDWPTPALAYRADGTTLQPALEYRGNTSGEIRAFPNPFGASGVWLQGYIPAGKGLRVFDNRGRLIHHSEHSATGQNQFFFLPASVFPESGTYYYQVEGHDKLAGKLLYIR